MAEEKAESISGVLEKSLGSPLRALVRGRRSMTAPWINFLKKLNMPRNCCRAGWSAGREKAGMADTCL